jgi:histidinol-phosphate aminotransferase
VSNAVKILPRKAILAMSAYSAPLEGRRNKVRLDFNENTTGFPWAHFGFLPEMINAYPEYDDFLAALSE